MPDEEKKVEGLKSTPTRAHKKVGPNPEWVASMQRAHEIKVIKFLAGGEK